MANSGASIRVHHCDDGSAIIESFVEPGDILDVIVVPSPERCTDPKHNEEGCPSCRYVGA